MAKGQRFSATDLQELASLALQKAGVPASDADTTARILVEADLRGVDSHGVGHLNGMYVKSVLEGRANPTPDIRVTRGSSMTAVVDGDKGLGFVVGHKAMSEAIGMAREHGCGWVAVRNSSHFGAGAYYAMMALEYDMIGFSFTSAGPLVVPPGSIWPLAGGNVIAVAAPGNKHGPFVLDMATCVVARGKVEIAARTGESIPTGWAIDVGGKPLTDPNRFFSGGGAILPLGSTISHGAYKGFGLALVVEILAGLLSGAGSFLQMAEGVCHAFGTINLDTFMGSSIFKGLMDEVIDRIHAAPRMKGVDAIMYPGERENLVKEERQILGIPLHLKVVEDLRQMRDELGIQLEIHMGFGWKPRCLRWGSLLPVRLCTRSSKGMVLSPFA